MSYSVFTIGSGFRVLGFTFRIIQATSWLTEPKNPLAMKRLQRIGYSGILAGVLVALVSFIGMFGNERATMIITGLNIGLIGAATALSSAITPQNQKVLEYAAYGCIGLGLLMCVAYKLSPIFKW